MSAPSPWIMRFAGLVKAETQVLDIACGAGRHTRFFAGSGHDVTAVDRDLAGIADLSGVEKIEADLEDGSPWPLTGRKFGAVIVANYLWRPLLPDIIDMVGPGGVLIYETFARGNEVFGRPSNPDFLLKPGELLEAVRGKLQVVAYEHAFSDDPKPAMRQRICAIAPGS